MRALRIILVACLTLLFAGCKPQGRVQLHSAQIARVMSYESLEEGQMSLPERVVLALDVENGGAAVVLRKGRLRVSYRGRRVAMFTLDDKVRIAGRSREVVMLPLKVSVARNSQSAALWQALMRHEAEQISVDWEVAGRSGIVSARLEQPLKPLSEVLEGSALEYFWSVADTLTGAGSAEFEQRNN